MGFLASRQGVAERRIIDVALDLCRQFDHRGAPGHGAGLLLDIPWPILLDRFPEHVRLIAQHDVALGMFFLPFEPVPSAGVWGLHAWVGRHNPEGMFTAWNPLVSCEFAPEP